MHNFTWYQSILQFLPISVKMTAQIYQNEVQRRIWMYILTVTLENTWNNSVINHLGQKCQWYKRFDLILMTDQVSATSRQGSFYIGKTKVVSQFQENCKIRTEPWQTVKRHIRCCKMCHLIWTIKDLLS